MIPLLLLSLCFLVLPCLMIYDLNYFFYKQHLNYKNERNMSIHQAFVATTGESLVQRAAKGNNNK